MISAFIYRAGVTFTVQCRKNGFIIMPQAHKVDEISNLVVCMCFIGITKVSVKRLCSIHYTHYSY